MDIPQRMHIEFICQCSLFRSTRAVRVPATVVMMGMHESLSAHDCTANGVTSALIQVLAGTWHGAEGSAAMLTWWKCFCRPNLPDRPDHPNRAKCLCPDRCVTHLPLGIQVKAAPGHQKQTTKMPRARCRAASGSFRRWEALNYARNCPNVPEGAPGNLSEAIADASDQLQAPFNMFQCFCFCREVFGGTARSRPVWESRHFGGPLLVLRRRP
eukprot:3858556-Alexandrium_andersonii.AAC.1